MGHVVKQGLRDDRSRAVVHLRHLWGPPLNKDRGIRGDRSRAVFARETLVGHVRLYSSRAREALVWHVAEQIRHRFSVVGSSHCL